MIPVVFEDIETAVADYLPAQLAAHGLTVPVVVGVPNPAPAQFVRITRIGGPRANLVTDNPRIVAECHSTLGTSASNLAKLVRAVLAAAAPGYVSGVWVDMVIDRGVRFDPDPDTNQPRYLVTVDLWAAGVALT